MESKDEFRKIDIKNYLMLIIWCYYFDDTMRVIGIDFRDILLDRKSNKKYKLFIVIPLRIRFDEIVRFIKLMMELDNGYYLVGGMMKFVVRLNIL